MLIADSSRVAAPWSCNSPVVLFFLGIGPMTINSAEQRLNAAVLALVYLGRCRERSYVTHSEIAREQNMLTRDVMNLMRSLAAAGFVTARPGRQGGVRISKPLSRISIKELYEACKSGTTTRPKDTKDNGITG
jgi:DNA-binding IscR family transcriptional regulator